MTNTEAPKDPRTIGYAALYGGKPCKAFPMPCQSTGELDFSTFHVSLDKDPGFGSMNFFHIHRNANLVFIEEPPAVIVPAWARGNQALIDLL